MRPFHRSAFFFYAPCALAAAACSAGGVYTSGPLDDGGDDATLDSSFSSSDGSPSDATLGTPPDASLDALSDAGSSLDSSDALAAFDARDALGAGQCEAGAPYPDAAPGAAAFAIDTTIRRKRLHAD
jgi:hypothetical protein